uniref:Uncharacterized protein n=1 Tax=Phage sp. ct4bw6 TaxID=2826747 RepID=A0A8S5MUC4_9VIRU|nr:MAG TPA: hypothetical protein [Phage sp. ct4bw6]
MPSYAVAMIDSRTAQQPATHLTAQEPTVTQTTTSTPTDDQLTDQLKVVADAASASLGLARVDEWRTGQIGLIKEHSPLQARMRVEEGRIVARMTGRERPGREVAGEMADVMAALVQHFEAPLPA